MSNIQIIKNIVYGETKYEYHTADLYLPSKGEGFPLVINVHGGAFQAGSKEMYSSWGPYLAENGIASMSVNYTLATPWRKSFPILIEDMESAIKFAVKNAAEWKINPMKMGFMGDSAGAYLGTMAAFGNERSSAKIKFVVCAYGVMDILDWAHYTNRARTDFVINKMFGQDPYTGQEIYKNASPIEKIDEAAKNPMFDTSFFMIWGEEDTVVLPENQTLAFIKRLEKLKIPHRKCSVPGFGHFWFTKNDYSEGNELIPVIKDNIGPKVVEFIKEVVTADKKADPNA